VNEQEVTTTNRNLKHISTDGTYNSCWLHILTALYKKQSILLQRLDGNKID